MAPKKKAKTTKAATAPAPPKTTEKMTPAPPSSSSSSLGEIFSRSTQAVFFNLKPAPIQRMLDFDYVCGRDTPSVAVVVQPGAPDGGFHKAFFGKEEVAIPVVGSIPAATKLHPTADVFINFASFRSAFESSMAALKEPTLRVVAVIAEGVPESDAKRLIAAASSANKLLIGPATVGGLQAGAFRIGDAAGTIENIVECGLHVRGSVGFVSKSGGMSNECYSVLSRATDGLYEGVAIGGDSFPGSTLSDHALRYEAMPGVKMMVVLGELGGVDEYTLVDALKEKRITKPVVAWASGTCAPLFKSEVQFGHAGARSGSSDAESAAAKNRALQEAGAVVPDSFEGFEAAIKGTYDALVAEGKAPAPRPRAERAAQAPPLPLDLPAAKRQGVVRVPTNVVSTICDDRGEEPTYSGVPMSELINSGAGVGDAVSLLWFKRRLPPYAVRFVEICIVLCADHGPCVSGAHNAIVTSRAGKDLVSSLVSGLLTIGPRFGGAIDDAARRFQAAVDAGRAPDEYVEWMKRQGERVPGIGHRIKSKDNRDARVALLQAYARKFFPATRYLDYAVQVEEYTLTKAANLLLNVDGCIGALFLDLLWSCGMFSEAEVREVVRIGYLNGLFVLARAIGLIGHALDQQRLRQPLYRHPWDEVLYTR